MWWQALPMMMVNKVGYYALLTFEQSVGDRVLKYLLPRHESQFAIEISYSLDPHQSSHYCNWIRQEVEVSIANISRWRDSSCDGIKWILLESENPIY